MTRGERQHWHHRPTAAQFLRCMGAPRGTAVARSRTGHSRGGSLHRRSSADAPAQSDAILELALRKAKEQNAKSLELRISLDLAKSWLSHGKREQARDLLTPICDWFKEGAETKDLTEARAVLSKL